MCNLLWIAHLVVFNLVYVDSLSEFVCFTERDYRYFMLTREISNHARTYGADDATITKDIAGTNEHFCCLADEATDALE